MAAKFILSLDCEGKWGGADKQDLPHNRALTDETLLWSYESIVQLLNEYEIPSTFAFVGCFVMNEAERKSAADELQHFSQSSPYVKAALRRKNDNGWFGERYLDLVRSARVKHEIGLHGVTHVPWKTLNRDQAELEMSILRHASSVAGARTFIFPRNQVAHLDVLSEYGFVGFRAEKKYAIPAGHMIEEINPFVSPEQNPRILPGEIVAIPPGFFVNWKSGARKMIPTWFSSLRSNNMIRCAVDGNVVHYWTHPENVASSPKTMNVLRSIVKNAAKARDKGKLEIMTLLGYCGLFKAT